MSLDLTTALLATLNADAVVCDVRIGVFWTAVVVEQPSTGRQCGLASTAGAGQMAQERHARMAAAVADCEALLCGGMGWGAYQSVKQLNITPVVTDIFDAEEAEMAYVNGSIVDHVDQLH